ncbi:Hypp5213 [Branchiostoma lanceolatum]|uniref:Hypp5213 protein n=1 Tax=Branchiostoma lanceolatum TaxID=7740 RepID=A0A8K0ADD1_BRALA|nr:Hypp5213 [Branchiostoma lanceolatum]
MPTSAPNDFVVLFENSVARTGESSRRNGTPPSPPPGTDEGTPAQFPPSHRCDRVRCPLHPTGGNFTKSNSRRSPKMPAELEATRPGPSLEVIAILCK